MVELARWRTGESPAGTLQQASRIFHKQTPYPALWLLNPSLLRIFKSTAWKRATNPFSGRPKGLRARVFVRAYEAHRRHGSPRQKTNYPRFLLNKQALR